MTPIYLFDLDGTLCDLRHRLHYLLVTPKNYDAFFAECINDSPHQDVLRLLNLISRSNPIGIVSGRSSAARHHTFNWLKKYNIHPIFLFMRQVNDHRPDWIVKKEIYLNHIKPSYEVLGVFDDRQQVVDMWRSQGLRCYQVAPSFD